MKILILTNRIPYPLKDGGSLAMHYFIEGYLEAKEEVSVLAMNTSKHWIDPNKLPNIYKNLSLFETVYVDNKVQPMGAFLNLFQKTSYNIDRFDNEAYRAQLITILSQNEYDLIQLESLFLTPYVQTIRQYSKAKIVMRSHNVEYKIWERLAIQSKNPIKKAYLNLLTQRLKKYEIAHLNDYDIMVPISKTDEALLKTLGCTIPIYTQTFGIKIDTYQHLPERALNQPLKLYHLGAMDWLPNLESVQWLLDKIMPQLAVSHPDVTLYLAGRNMPEQLLQQQYPNVVIIGEVEDALAFEQDKDVLVVPLLSGGGVRIKIFQGMVMGKAVVTTPVGVEGIAVENDKEVKIAATASEFIKAIQDLLDHPEKIKYLGENAKELMAKDYDRKKQIGELLAYFYQQIKSLS